MAVKDYKTTSVRVSREFGFRILKGKPNDHKGIDFPFGNRTPVSNWVAGKVVEVGYDGYKVNRGRFVIIEAGPNLRVSYHSMDRIDVKVGQQVGLWQTVGLSGNTAYGTGPHLHVGVWRKINGVWTAVNPRSVFKIPGTGKVDVGGSTPATGAGKVLVDGKDGKQTNSGLQRRLVSVGWGTLIKVIDGIRGNKGPTNKAYQGFLARRTKNIITVIDGIFGKQSVRAEQTWLKSIGEYSGPIDGIRGSQTISALQRAINRDDVWKSV